MRAARASWTTCGSSTLLDELAQRLRSSGADPSRLVFERTETCAIANISRAQIFAMSLRALGCRLALDDFGTGFGSFTYLKHLPADYLKVDREFVRNLAHSAHDRRVVDSIAEGVEDQACVEALRDAGVGLAQGYHLGRPVPIVTPSATTHSA